MNPHQSWFDVDGDNTYALDWDLNENSLVWEIGGFEGRWAQQIWDKFHCRITIFEPQLWAVERMKKRFDGIGKIDIHPYGLSVTEKEWSVFPIGAHETDGAGIYAETYHVREVVFRNIYAELSEFPEAIDLALMNIEGMEYDLLPSLISLNQISIFKHFWCQFHPGLVSDDGSKGHAIFEGMTKTHDMIWNFYPTAVAWRRR